MAGHSKWANIKHRKGAQDKKRSKIFTKVLKEITVAIKENNNNGDPETNPALRNALLNARGVNMPKENIERAIKKATGADADNYEYMSFEGYGPNGIAFFIECMTNNTNRTVASVRSIFNKHKGSLSTSGSVEFLFETNGVFTVNKDGLTWDLEELQLELIEAGAVSFGDEEDIFTIYTEFNQFGTMASKLEALKIEVQRAEIQRIPLETKELNIEDAKEILKLIDAFEDDEDVQDIFHDLELTDELIAHIEG
ncbi:YebC/PmpR family DNA-binding transcriptional regulator [Albibacterium indicum]|uniref:YebC/PmpR family DNA-binding transcriptional regulator n=1 Tax=Albibacterium indicum TaxID=2292082 RepID=UPI000E480713|nr:YebC/PmpR family DNA-binding transcriptional regulator [Pedobacter indicus]